MPNTQYREFFLGADTDVIEIEAIKISHSSFSRVYRLVRNWADTIMLTETAGQPKVEYMPYPLRIEPQGIREDLSFGIDVTFGELGKIIPMELARLRAAEGGIFEKPALEYRTYRSDMYKTDNHILSGPFELEVERFGVNREGTLLEARAPNVNTQRTGELYTFERFPMLRGVL